ncbi:MAG TPA: D-2-hydroxyacid dehydrogenase [Bacteroidota bacterium]|nr:D-2-hydroxyacid dehydrogenase [Candidatus Kapabacteria bacterium]HRS01942.1 D-2-hydroxyacid dehydrogenase [Bacteroidota bacterium]HRT67459.1 D-2-hydroxyacid dehydrogenase [Bacteroidota bacterium]
MKLLISDGMSKEGIEILQNAGIEILNQKFTPEELLKVIGDYDGILVRSATKVTKEVIDAGKNLKVIARGGVGLDNVDVEYAKQKGIKVMNTPGASSISVAELAIAHMFAIARFLYKSTAEMKAGKWPKKEYSEGFELTGKTLGIIGIGNIGKEVAKRALGLGMKVIAYDPYVTTIDMNVQLVSKDELLAQSDIITLHIPKQKDGYAIAAPEFEKMKNGVVLINCARGGVVSEEDLLNALNSGKVRAAGIDVFANEPPTEAQKELINHPNVSLSPHIGGSTPEAQTRIAIEIANKIVDAFKNLN